MQNERHWSELSPNPIADDTRLYVKELLHKKHRGPIDELGNFWDSQIRDRTVLDIGVVEHSLEFTKRHNWKHRIFKSMASRIVGVDILAGPVKELNDQGYDIRLCDATSDADLGERFEVVYIGDVIEHVNDPVRLLAFAARHLAPNGKILVTTPCPFWWRNIASMVSDKTFIGNVDHVRWVCPVHALEIGNRASVRLDRYYTVETNGNTKLKKLAHRFLNRLFDRAELFTWAYVYVYTIE